MPFLNVYLKHCFNVKASEVELSKLNIIKTGKKFCVIYMGKMYFLLDSVFRKK